VERAIGALFHDVALWPILAVAVGHVGAILAPLLLLGLRDRQLRPAAGLLLFAGLTAAGVASELRRERRPGPVTAFALLGWGVAALLAWLAARHGLF